MVGEIICIFLLSILYVLFGGVVCPNVIEERWLRITILLLWPLYLVLMIVSIPFMMVWVFSDSPKENEKAINDFVRKLNER